jgi:arabinan endo-1,5-alpha-L-arabinosidase
VCNPSRSALLSGIAPYRSGIYDNNDEILSSKLILSASFLPEHFKANGYETLTRGKIFHSAPDKERYAAMWTIDSGKGNYGPGSQAKNFPKDLKVPPMFNYEPWTGPDTDHPDNVTAQATMAWLKQQHDRPFFIAAGLYKPHNPWTAPKEFFDQYKLEDIQLPSVLEGDWDDLPLIAKKWAGEPVDFDALKKSGKWKEVVRSYLACITFMDWNLGRILAALDEGPNKSNTIVCVFADNGFHMGEKKHFAKYALWEKTTHILHMWRVPGVTKSGQQCERPVNLLDIYPTLVELCGLPKPPQQLDGRSMVSLLQNPKASWTHPSVTTYQQGNQAIRTERYRYIRYADGEEELYDEEKDPNEWRNLAKDPSMKDLINGFRQKITPSFVPGAGKKKAQLKKINNPLFPGDFADPTVIVAEEKYYAYATNSKASGTYQHIQLAASNNLTDWQRVGDALPEGAVWAKGDFWAPHVLFDKDMGKYIMYYSAQSISDSLGKCLGVAFADKPEGPFKDIGRPFLAGKSYINIDPYAMIDPASGKKLLYWGSAHLPIHVQELSADWRSFKNGSVKKPVIFPKVEGGYDRLVEGAWIDYHDGYHYLYYSGDNCCGPNAHYAVLVARSKNAFGPFERLGETAANKSSVVLEKNEEWLAPGHNSIFRDGKGNAYIACHAIAADQSNAKGRVFVIHPMVYKNGWPEIHR